MAGHASKKRAREAAEQTSYYWLAVGIALALFLVLRVFVCFGYTSRIPSTYEYFLLLFTFCVLYGAYRWKLERVLLGLNSSTATDLHIVSLVSLALGGLHPWGWAIWLSVPVYCTYLIIRWIITWVFTPDTPDENTPEALAYQKKQAKLERKLKSGRYTMM